MAIAFIDSVQRLTAGTSGEIDTTGATLLVAQVVYIDATTLSDSEGNTWTARTERTAAFGAKGRLYYAENPNVSATHTFTLTGGTHGAVGVTAFSGTATSSVFDTETGQSDQFSTAEAGSLTPSQNASLVIASIVQWTSLVGDQSIDDGYTLEEEWSPNSGGDHRGGGIAYLIQTTAAATDPSWTFGGGGDAGVALTAFKPAAGGAAGQPTMRRWGGVPHMGTTKFRNGGRGGPWGRTTDGLIVPRRLAA